MFLPHTYLSDNHSTPAVQHHELKHENFLEPVKILEKLKVKVAFCIFPCLIAMIEDHCMDILDKSMANVEMLKNITGRIVSLYCE